MDTKGNNTNASDSNSIRSEEFDPDFERVQNDRSQTLMLELAGFKKENLKAMLSSSGKSVEITGERYLDGNRRRWFRKVVSLPKNYTEKEIQAKFQDGVLYLTIPTTAEKSNGDQQKTSTVPEQAKEKLAAAKEAVASGTEKLQEKLSSKKSQVNEQKEKVRETAGDGAGKLKEKVRSMVAEIGQKKAETMETAEATAGKWKEKMAYKKNELAGAISERKTPLVNVVAAVVVLVGIGLYVYYKFERPVEEINSMFNAYGIIN